MNGTDSRPLVTYSGDRHILRLHAYGSREVTEFYVHRMQQLGFSEIHEWTEPILTGRPLEYIRLFTKSFRIE